MELEGTVHNGIIVPDDASQLPEGTRVRIESIPAQQPEKPVPSFLERYGKFMVDDPDAPTDLAAQHDHYRLGVPKR